MWGGLSFHSALIIPHSSFRIHSRPPSRSGFRHVCSLRLHDLVDDVQAQLAADDFVAHAAGAKPQLAAARDREARAELLGAEYLDVVDAGVNRVLHQARQPWADEGGGDVPQLEFADGD